MALRPPLPLQLLLLFLVLVLLTQALLRPLITVVLPAARLIWTS